MPEGFCGYFWIIESREVFSIFMKYRSNMDVFEMTEQSLHEQLKERYSEDSLVEENVDGYIVDVVCAHLLIEIQTGNFSNIQSKLEDLLENHRIRLVHPIPYKKWIIRLDEDGNRVSRRRSPKRGKVEDVFYELVYIPKVCVHPNFELEVVLVNAEEFWIDDGKGSWRREGWSIHDRKLLTLKEKYTFDTPRDYLDLLPNDLPDPFTSRQLSKHTEVKIRLARKISYCLRKMGLLKIHGKKGQANLYTVEQTKNS